jgi:hypothetical protein
MLSYLLKESMSANAVCLFGMTRIVYSCFGYIIMIEYHIYFKLLLMYYYTQSTSRCLKETRGGRIREVRDILGYDSYRGYYKYHDTIDPQKRPDSRET